MKKIVLFALLSVIVIIITACGGNGGETSSHAESAAPEYSGVSEVSQEISEVLTETKSVKAYGIVLDLPSDYIVEDKDDIIMIKTTAMSETKDIITIVSVPGSLSEFTEKSMTAAMQTDYDFEKFNDYKKVESEDKTAVVYDFDTVYNGVAMNIKQINVQSGENVVTVTFCLVNEGTKEQFDVIADSVKVENQ